MEHPGDHSEWFATALGRNSSDARSKAHRRVRAHKAILIREIIEGGTGQSERSSPGRRVTRVLHCGERRSRQGAHRRVRRECHEICRLCLQAAIFFECANQPSQDANSQNFIAEPSKCHVNSAAEEVGLETMRTVKGRIARRPDNCVTNESFEETECHAIRDNRDHFRRTSRRGGRTIFLVGGRKYAEPIPRRR